MKRFTKVLVGLAIAAVLTVAAVVAAAQSADDCAPTTAPAPRLGMWECGHWMVFDAAAEALGLTPQQLFTELHGGKTLQEVAEAQGIDPETVQEAMTGVRAEARKAAIEQAVKDGKLTRAQADWMFQGMELGLGRLGEGPHGFRGEPGGPR
jgi:hypothetical protein